MGDLTLDVHKLRDMYRGWFVGDFEPVALKTEAFEVAVKHYRAGEREERHYHKVATELTVVVSGEVLIGGTRFEAGDIVVTRPGEAQTFEAITDTALTIVKVPSVKGDKYSA
jgi:quercetin dioxygenase-like cupin family protein